MTTSPWPRTTPSATTRARPATAPPSHRSQPHTHTSPRATPWWPTADTFKQTGRPTGAAAHERLPLQASCVVIAFLTCLRSTVTSWHRRGDGSPAYGLPWIHVATMVWPDQVTTLSPDDASDRVFAAWRLSTYPRAVYPAGRSALPPAMAARRCRVVILDLARRVVARRYARPPCRSPSARNATTRGSPGPSPPSLSRDRQTRS